jgi:hypothetical protein
MRQQEQGGQGQDSPKRTAGLSEHGSHNGRARFEQYCRTRQRTDRTVQQEHDSQNMTAINNNEKGRARPGVPK